MKIKILSPLKIRGKKSGLYNYAYFAESGEQISATFQDTKLRIKSKQRQINENALHQRV
tara:strand:- start:164 stop:340 length:177 start_codon:yes stop_codon:yes gene_type:complete